MADPVNVNEILSGASTAHVFEPFRDGIEICRLLEGEPAVAMLRYSPGATVPRHTHRGLETVLVLEGAQRDDHGVYGPGTLILNEAGSDHAVASDDGCIVLIQWAKPIEFHADGDGAS